MNMNPRFAYPQPIPPKSPRRFGLVVAAGVLGVLGFAYVVGSIVGPPPAPPVGETSAASARAIRGATCDGSDIVGVGAAGQLVRFHNAEAARFCGGGESVHN